MPKTAKNHRVKARKVGSLGPVDSLEEYVQPDWWRRIFNSLYLKTDADVVDDERITREEVDLFLSILDPSPEDRILDLCCGQGRHSIELARRGFLRVEGLDRSRFLVRKAREQAAREGLPVKFREGDARKIPYPPDTFDVVLLLGNSFGYFESKRDDLRVLKEIFRVLKPGGKVLIDVADGDYLRKNFDPRSWEWLDAKHFVCRERALSRDGERLISREVITHVEKGVIADQFYAERLYTPDTLRKLLEEAGFSDIAFPAVLSPDSARNQDLGMMARRIITTAVARKDWTPVRPRRAPSTLQVAVVMGDPRKPDPLKPGGVFDEDDLHTIHELKRALHDLPGFSFVYLDNHDTLLQDLLKLRGKVDLVFNLCDEGFQNDARKELHVPALLEILGIPYTGATPQSLAICYDKSLVRGIAREMGIPVPRGVLVDEGEGSVRLPFPFPAIVKPVRGDSSQGITTRSVVHSPEELVGAIREIREKFGYEGPLLIEEFLTGKDLTLGIIGNVPDAYNVLPIVEEDYSVLPPGLPRICGYEAKWLPDSPYWQLRSIPAELPEEVERLMVESSLRLFERLECRDYCRFDWRLDGEGRPRLLEVNPNPGWCWDGHLAKMAAVAGISYRQMLQMILEAACARLGLSEPGGKA